LRNNIALHIIFFIIKLSSVFSKLFSLLE
jgi:hypothetical protein